MIQKPKNCESKYMTLLFPQKQERECTYDVDRQGKLQRSSLKWSGSDYSCLLQRTLKYTV